jgi:hypothetical protein
VCYEHLKVGDVLLKIDGMDIASDGLVELEGERVILAEVAERKFKGDVVTFDILRDGKPMQSKVEFHGPFPYTHQANSYAPARYVVHAGLLFQPLNRNLFATFQFQNPRVQYYYARFVDDELYKDRDETIVLTSLLPDPINTYLDEFREGIVKSVNGKPIRNIKELAAAFDEKTEQLLVEFEGIGRPLVLNTAEVEAARDRIRKRYNVQRESFLEDEAK